MSIVKRDDGLYWPSFDVSCREWTAVEVSSVNHIAGVCENKRSIIHAGANVGAYALKFAEIFGRVYAFEPDRTNFKCLALNTTDADNVFLFNAALGDCNLPISLSNCESDNCGTFKTEFGGNIPMLTIDNLGLTDVGCIHLDLEGFEAFALIGAMQTIKRSSPTIVVEWMDHGSKYGWPNQSIMVLLGGLGYTKMKLIGSDMAFIK